MFKLSKELWKGTLLNRFIEFYTIIPACSFGKKKYVYIAGKKFRHP
jgi:hypothetical protein